MKLKKFKNGSINMKLEKSDKFYHSRNSGISYDDKIKQDINIIDIDNIYNTFITMNDLYFNQIDGDMYLVDTNTRLIYDFSSCYINVLMHLKNILINKYNKNETLKLTPLSKKECGKLFQDLENGY